MFGYDYLIGDPAVREKLNGTLRVVGMSIVLGFSCISASARFCAAWCRFVHGDAMPFNEYGQRQNPPCEQNKSDCLAFSSGRCRCLHDTHFTRDCPFYANAEMVKKKLPRHLARDFLSRRGMWEEDA